MNIYQEYKLIMSTNSVQDNMPRNSTLRDTVTTPSFVLDTVATPSSYITSLPCMTSHLEKEKRVECSNLDRISTLPEDIIVNILTLMPFKDALRTSILSRTWRYKWTSTHSFYINGSDMISESNNLELDRIRLTNAIFHVLLLHKTPFMRFSWIVELDMSFEIDQIILYLSRNNALRRFMLANYCQKYYKLPDSFFSFQKLETLFLQECIFEPPLTFYSFSTLRCLRFYCNVKITTKSLKRILTNSPLLEELELFGVKERGDPEISGIAQRDKLSFVDLFKSSPLLRKLEIIKYYMEHFATLDMPSRLPISIVNLKHLYLGASFMEKDELLCCFCLIKSSPNLTDLFVKNEQLHDSPLVAKNLLDLQERSNFKLDHLDKLEMMNFRNLAVEMDFLKLIVTQAPVLRKVKIRLNDIYYDKELKLFKDAFPHASTSVKFKDVTSWKQWFGTIVELNFF